MTLRSRLTLAFVVVVLVPLLVGGLLVIRAVPTANAARQAETVTASARLVATVLAGYCDRAAASADAAGRAGTTPTAARRAVDDLVARGLVDGVRVVANSGVTIASAGAVPPPDLAGNCARGAPGSAPAPGSAQVAGSPHYLSAVVSLMTVSGAPAGTAIASYRVDAALADRLQAAVGFGQVALLAGGRVVASSGPVPAALVRRLLAAPGQVARAGGQLGMVSAARDGQPYAVLVTLPQTLGPGLLPLTIAILVGAVLLAAALGWLLARATTRPLAELGRAAARIAAGDLDTTIEVRSRDEVGQLAGTFNVMTGELRAYVRALEAGRDELQAGLSRLGDTLSSTHDLERILSVVLETAMVSTRAQAGMLLLLGPARDRLVLSVDRGLAELALPTGLTIPVGTGISGRVAQSGEAIRGRIGDSAGLLQPGPDEPRSGSVIAVPLKSSGTVIGVLDLFWRLDAPEFDDRDLTTIRTFASQASVAVENVLFHEEAQRLSITDGLTGLWNYRYFTMTVGKEIDRSARFGRPLALLMLDLDLFKRVNDGYGHQRGDAVLVEFAARVRAQVRDVDTVARYGGEEVIVILPETDEAGAAQAAERICDAIRRRPFGEATQAPIAVTVSVGAAVFPLHGASSTVLLRRADRALYEAKSAGRDTWRMAEARPATEAEDGPAH